MTAMTATWAWEAIEREFIEERAESGAAPLSDQSRRGETPGCGGDHRRNPSAHGGAGGALGSHGHESTREAEALSRMWARQCREEGQVYALGGDGTLNEVVNGVAGQDQVAVGCCPLGSGNDFVKLFGQSSWRFRDLSALVTAQPHTLDLIECNGRLAINICSVGFDARIGLGMVDYKRLPLVSGRGAYLISLAVNTVRGIHRPYELELDGERFSGDFTLICACNGQWYGGSFHPSPDAVPDDGLLDFVVVPAVSRLTILTLIGKYAKGGAGDIPRILLRRGREMHVACERADRINLDGEELVDSELSVRVSAKKVNFFFPEGTHWIPEKRVRN